MKRKIPQEALVGSLKDFRRSRGDGSNILSRAHDFFAWQDLRRQHGFWPYARASSTAPQARCEAISDSGQLYSGVNFASQDYLSLASHSKVKEAAMAAIERYGVHSAGSAALLGNTEYSLELSARLSRFLGARDIVLYPTGWAAGYGAIQGFVRSEDHVVLDVLAHSCLQAGAAASTQKVHFHRHLDLDAVARILARIRATDTKNGILLVTESLFSMHSDTPDLRAMRVLCDTYGASMLVDCAHDLGCLGDDGRGHMGKQEILDEIDIIVGSFSKTFASNGGFTAVNGRSAAEYLKYYSATHTFSNALSPAQAAVVLEALAIVQSEEGRQLRRRLYSNILNLRKSMTEHGRKVLGVPSPIVPVHVGGEALGRLVSRNLSEFGAIANLVEYPAVPRNESRFRFQVMASHTSDDIQDVVVAFGSALQAAHMTVEEGELDGSGTQR